ncbi:MAG: RNA 2',3'-cyclic phosphodiesterase [Pseudomonadota bacterium]
MRAFVGLPVPESWGAPILSLQGALGVGRAVAEENLHITLAFLDEISTGQAEELHAALELRRLRRVSLSAEGLQTFGGERPKLIALEICAHPALTDLHRSVARAAEEAGIALERRRFRPHVTLARFGHGLSPEGQGRLRRSLEGLTMPELAEAEIRVARLYRSHLGPGGASYEVLAEYLLS